MDAAWGDGDAVLPVDPTLPRIHADRLVGRLRPAVVRRPDRVEHHTGAPPVPPGTAVVLATSGSTGVPKGIVLSHETLGGAIERSRARLGAGDGQPWLGVLPLHHVAGLSVLLRSRAAGVEPTLHESDRVAAIDLAPPSWLSLVPTQLDRLLEAGVDLARHHGVLLGGAHADTHLLLRAERAGVHVVTSYGMTETSGGCVYDGQPLDDVELRAGADSVLRVRGPVVADGVRMRDGTVRPLVDDDGWLRTKDLGVVTPDGRVLVDGRADDVVVSGGEQVPLLPVRRALASLDSVRESAVVGLPDQRWGTAVTAVVVPTDPADDRIDVVAIRDELRGMVPPMHLPTRVLVVDELPRDPMGKVTARSVAPQADVDADLEAWEHLRPGR